MEQNILSQRELRRYEQQIELQEIGIKGQEKLKQAHVLVIGAGGKGTTALKTLVTAGVGYIGISDDSLVQEDTLGRQSLYGDNDIGKQKAIVSKQYLQARNQFADIKVHNIRLTAENLGKIIAGYDILIDCTNNYISHYAIDKAARDANKPLVFSSIHHNNALVVLLPNKSAKSLKDIIPDGNNYPLSNWDTSSPVVIINTLVGVIVANEAIKNILGKSSQLSSNVLEIAASDYSFVLRSL
jgi:sulfur-carrier protein adenylyltransferase/sulfurtransferase